MLTSRVYVLTGAVNGWLENSSPEQYSCNLMSTRQKTMRLRVHCAKTRSMFEPLDTYIKTRTRKCEVVYCQPGIISWWPCWIYAILDPADRQHSSSIVFPVSENILLRHTIRVSTIYFRESVIICSELFNMGRIGNFFIFMPHFDNVPELSRLYTFSMS